MMQTDRKKDINAKMAIAEALLGKTTGASKGYRPPPDATVKVKPLGGLIPKGAKVTWQKKF